MATTTYTRGIMELVNNRVKALTPILDTAKDNFVFDEAGNFLPEKSTLIVRGGGRITTNDEEPAKVEVNYEERWCTIPVDEVSRMISLAHRDGTIREVRMLSFKAGSSVVLPNSTVDAAGRPRATRFQGNEAGLLVQLNGSDEAKAYAEKYSFADTIKVTIPVQATGQEVEQVLENAFIISYHAFAATQGLIYPEIDRSVKVASRMDSSNPDWLDAINLVKATGSLPARDTRTFSGRVAMQYAS